MAINPLPLAGVGLAAVAVAGGLYATGTGTSDTEKSILETIDFLSEDTEFKKSDGQYNDKWGKDYGRYLVDPNKNTEWWSKKYQTFKADQTTKTDKFKDVTESENNSLNKICDLAYKAEKTSVKTQSPSATEFNETHIWKYCSPFGEKPEAIQTTESYAGTLAQDATQKTILISITSTKKSNKLFWELKQIDFKKDQTFKTETRTVKKWCEEAYKTVAVVTSGSTDTNQQMNESNTLKWCSLEGKKKTT